MVVANEVRGRWSPEALAFLHQLAKAKARNEAPLMQRTAQQAWKMRWLAIIVVCSSPGCVELVVGTSGSSSGTRGLGRSPQVFRYLCDVLLTDSLILPLWEKKTAVRVGLWKF